MSFILDALKKSENDRQRQTGPALFEVKVAPPKAGFPVWAIAIVVLLVINMVIVGWLLLRHQSKTEDATANGPQVASQPAPTPPAPSPTIQAAPTNTAPQPVQNNSQPVQQAYPPPPSQQVGAPSQGPSNAQSPDAEDKALIAGRAISGRDQNEPTLGDSGNRAASTGGAGGSSASRSGGGPAAMENSTTTAAGNNPDDYVPAQDPGSPLFKGHVKRGTESGLMLYQDLAVTNGANLPELRLDMHVYDPKPQARFALINMQKVTEGQMMKGEVKVEAITPEGVVMSHNGTRFLLPRE
jgi:general secretion pathway protein B